MSYFGRKLNTIDQDIYITSDLHFWHKAILSFCEQTRPWDTLEEMHKALITEWNSKVKPNDIIFHLGDFSFKGKEATDEILSQLNGKKIMILGNHDKVLRNSIKVGEHDIEEICDYLELCIDGIKIIMSHFPQSCWNQQGRESLMFHGHTHGSFQGQGKIVDVGYDSFGEIINIKRAVKYCETRPTYCPDHHKIVEENNK